MKCIVPCGNGSCVNVRSHFQAGWCYYFPKICSIFSAALASLNCDRHYLSSKTVVAFNLNWV